MESTGSTRATGRAGQPRRPRTAWFTRACIPSGEVSELVRAEPLSSYLVVVAKFVFPVLGLVLSSLIISNGVLREKRLGFERKSRIMLLRIPATSQRPYRLLVDLSGFTFVVSLSALSPYGSEYDTGSPAAKP